jgi:hypothetical protein
MVTLLAMLVVASLDTGVTTHGSDAITLRDPMRPITEISRTSCTLQYYTQSPCETRVQIRQSDMPMVAWRPADKKIDWWAQKDVRTIEPGKTKTTVHELKIDGLLPGKRYYYRVYDPAANPTPQEATWGATKPWRREFAVSTLAPKGQKTIIYVPVKVLLMPNVVNVESAHTANGVIPLPPKMTPKQLARIKEEYKIASRFYWVNNGMRVWVDFQIQVDDRWQRWGPEPAKVDAAYKGLPACRSWAGVDYAAPGGGDFTIIDTKDPLKVNKEPVFEEKPYDGQVEQAFAQKWNPKTSKWEFYGSGGGTFGVDGLPQGVPGRSQYLGGSDTAWLATHEFHHQMESWGAFSLSDREDERIVYDHPDKRRRIKKEDGSWDEVTWNTAFTSGDHWDCIEWADRLVSTAQWLRMYVGYTMTVKDADEDGVPDDDARLPLDEKRFGSNTKMAATDGAMNDLDKVMLSTWVPAVLQYTFTKPPFQAKTPSPLKKDSDGDGIVDTLDPYPVYPWKPFVWPVNAVVDGDDQDWKDVPLSGEMNEGGIHATFQQGHTDEAYFACIKLKGPWKKMQVMLDGEGEGVFTNDRLGVYYITFTRDNPTPQISGGKIGHLETKLGKAADGSDIIEFTIPNRGDSQWYWYRGGRKVGVFLDVTDEKDAQWSMYEPYRTFYSIMLEPTGRWPMPAGAPSELKVSDATYVLKPGDPQLSIWGKGWNLVDGALRYSTGEDSCAYVGGLSATDFDIWVSFEAKLDAVLGAFAPGTKEMNPGGEYVAFLGGYDNTVTRFRLYGREESDSEYMLTPGKHTMQMSRRNGRVWFLVDGKPAMTAVDPDPTKIVDRIGMVGCGDGKQVLYELRVRVGK